MEKLNLLATYHIHSIEQPIEAGQYDQMAVLCNESPIPVALDEELIGDFSPGDKLMLIQRTMPAYIILKPSLTGGFGSCLEWISAAERNKVGWWATSALESNIGLNAIAQWVAMLSNDKVQGLGTGNLYSNNIGSPLTLDGPNLYYDPAKTWETDGLFPNQY
jgi:L-alanine-DL-glutamate epimerase-like enolase superfamily enzyme